MGSEMCIRDRPTPLRIRKKEKIKTIARHAKGEVKNVIIVTKITNRKGVTLPKRTMTTTIKDHQDAPPTGKASLNKNKEDPLQTILPLQKETAVQLKLALSNKVSLLQALLTKNETKRKDQNNSEIAKDHMKGPHQKAKIVRRKEKTKLAIPLKMSLMGSLSLIHI